jgi:hypothetical protein
MSRIIDEALASDRPAQAEPAPAALLEGHDDLEDSDD